MGVLHGRGAKQREVDDHPGAVAVELQGFGSYSYGRGEPPSHDRGLYRHRFQLPAVWRGKEVFIVFDGVMTDTEVKVNGKLAGPKHQGGFYRFRYDVSDLVRYGRENLLEVTVDEESAPSAGNDHDVVVHARRMTLGAEGDGKLNLQTRKSPWTT